MSPSVLATGSGIHVSDTGAGEPVVLLHSAGLSGRQWRRLASEIVEGGRRAIVPDLSGHGSSPPWLEPTPFVYRTDVDRVASILRAVGPAHVVGHSYGGLVALQAAQSVPGAVRTLSLFDPVAFGVLDADADRDARAVLASLDLSWGADAAGRERWLRTFVDFWGGSGAWLALRDDARDEFRRVAWIVREGVRTLMEDATPARAYAGVPFPVRLFTGALSPLPAQRVVQRIRDAVGDGRVTVVPGVGHLAPLTHPGAVNPALLRVVAGVDA